MPSTFTPNLGLENPAYLEQNNTWGTTENTARTMVDLSVGQASFTLTGATFAISVTNGSPTSSLARVWIFNGTPGVAVTITYSPNTAQNWVFVVNNTAQALTFKQGTGTTVTVIALGSNVIYFDGGGAAANAANFPTIPSQPPGSVTNPSYSFTGFSDVGLYVPGPSTLAIAANAATMASFQSSGAGPSGLNSLGASGINSMGASVGPYIGNAFSSNLDMFALTWAGPAVQPGYSFLYLNEATNQAFLKYLDSHGSQQVLLLGNYSGAPANLATYVGAAPASVPPSTAYYLANETTNELDLYYKTAAGALMGPFGREYYVTTNQPFFIGAAPPAALTAQSQYSYFQINEPYQELDWYYRGSLGQLHGPIPVATYLTTGTMAGAGPLAQYVGAAPHSIYNQNMYWGVNESTSELDWYYLDSGGNFYGPMYVSQYRPGGPTTWVNTYVPTCSANFGGWQFFGPPAPQCMYNYNSVTKTMAIQMLIKATATQDFPANSIGTFTISLPIPLASGPGTFAQSIIGDATTVGSQFALHHFVASGSSLNADYAFGAGGWFANNAIFLAFNGIVQTN